jgi:hypothetical protein
VGGPRVSCSCSGPDLTTVVEAAASCTMIARKGSIHAMGRPSHPPPAGCMLATACLAVLLLLTSPASASRCMHSARPSSLRDACCTGAAATPACDAALVQAAFTAGTLPQAGRRQAALQSDTSCSSSGGVDWSANCGLQHLVQRHLKAGELPGGGPQPQPSSSCCDSSCQLRVLRCTQQGCRLV